MKFALVDGQQQEAKPGLAGYCKFCESPCVAKCGEKNVWHWAHAKRVACDPWWENETEWHRAWKNNFPKEWQEVVHFSETGEKHIADVKTGKGLVVEFQHSHINPEERNARENFYKNMVWIVDGTRRKSDFKKFMVFLEDSRSLGELVPVRKLSSFLDESRLVLDWCYSNAPVIFDFKENTLWVLLEKLTKNRYILPINRSSLTSLLNSEHDSNSFKAVINTFNTFTSDYEVEIARQQRLSVGGNIFAPNLSNNQISRVSRRRF